MDESEHSGRAGVSGTLPRSPNNGRARRCRFGHPNGSRKLRPDANPPTNQRGRRVPLDRLDVGVRAVIGSKGTSSRTFAFDLVPQKRLRDPTRRCGRSSRPADGARCVSAAGSVSGCRSRRPQEPGGTQSVRRRRPSRHPSERRRSLILSDMHLSLVVLSPQCPRTSALRSWITIQFCGVLPRWSEALRELA